MDFFNTFSSAQFMPQPYASSSSSSAMPPSGAQSSIPDQDKKQKSTKKSTNLKPNPPKAVKVAKPPKNPVDPVLENFKLDDLTEETRMAIKRDLETKDQRKAMERKKHVVLSEKFRAALYSVIVDGHSLHSVAQDSGFDYKKLRRAKQINTMETVQHPDTVVVRKMGRPRKDGQNVITSGILVEEHTGEALSRDTDDNTFKNALKFLRHRQHQRELTMPVRAEPKPPKVVTDEEKEKTRFDNERLRVAVYRLLVGKHSLHTVSKDTGFDRKRLRRAAGINTEETAQSAETFVLPKMGRPRKDEHELAEAKLRRKEKKRAAYAGTAAVAVTVGEDDQGEEDDDSEDEEEEAAALPASTNTFQPFVKR